MPKICRLRAIRDIGACIFLKTRVFPREVMEKNRARSAWFRWGSESCCDTKEFMKCVCEFYQSKFMRNEKKNKDEGISHYFIH